MHLKKQVEKEGNELTSQTTDTGGSFLWTWLTFSPIRDREFFISWESVTYFLELVCLVEFLS